MDGRRDQPGAGNGQRPSGNRGRRRRRRGGGGGGGQPRDGQAREPHGQRNGSSGRPPAARHDQRPKPPITAQPTKKPEKPEPPFRHVVKRYGIAIYDSFQHARSDRETLAAKAKEVDQLNIVIRAEGNMDDPELLSIGNVKVFAGTAWTTIHERRQADGWYDEPR